MSVDNVDPFNYEPQEIDISEVNELGFSDEMVEELVSQIKEDLKGLSKVKDVLAALAPIGKLVVKIAAQSASDSLKGKLDDLVQ